MNLDAKQASRDPWALARRGCMGGLIVVGLLSSLLWITGLIPEQLSGGVFAAILVASLTCSLGIVFKAFALTGTAPGTNAGQLLQIAVLGDFVLQLMMLGGILLGMYLSGMKFASMTGFALAYAAVVFVFPLVATVILGKELQRQAKSAGVTAQTPVQDIPSS